MHLGPLKAEKSVPNHFYGNRTHVDVEFGSFRSFDKFKAFKHTEEQFGAFATT